MREFFQLLSGSVEMFGYHVPTAVLIIIALVGLSALLRNAWPAVVGGMMLFSYFFLLRFD